MNDPSAKPSHRPPSIANAGRAARGHRRTRSIVIGFAACAAVMLLAIVQWHRASARSLLSGSAATTQTGTVARVIDGDTIYVVVDRSLVKVRVIGVDTPELWEGAPRCFAQTAANFTRDATLSQRVRLTAEITRHDKYGRTLADVSILSGSHRGASLADLLATGGYARQLTIPPNTTHAARIAQLVAQAKQAQRGLWRACSWHAAFPDD